MASAAAPPQLSALDAIFQGLRNKSHDVRLRAAEDLKQYVKLSSLSCFSRSAQGLSSGHECGGRDVFEYGSEDVGRHNQSTSLRSCSQPKYVGEAWGDIGHWCVVVLSFRILDINPLSQTSCSLLEAKKPSNRRGTCLGSITMSNPCSRTPI